MKNSVNKAIAITLLALVLSISFALKASSQSHNVNYMAIKNINTDTNESVIKYYEF